MLFWRNPVSVWIRKRHLGHKHSYEGHPFDDDTGRAEDGRYRARVILAAGRASIDEEQRNDELALRTGGSSLC